MQRHRLSRGLGATMGVLAALTVIAALSAIGLHRTDRVALIGFEGSGSPRAERQRLEKVLEENRRLHHHNMQLQKAVSTLINSGDESGRVQQPLLSEASVPETAESRRPNFIASPPGIALKFEATSLKLGTPSEATDGLLMALGLDYATLGQLLQQGVDAIKNEFYNSGRPEDRSNFDYVHSCAAQDEACMPDHVKAAVAAGAYHGGPLAPGDYDFGHEGMKLNDFVSHEYSKLAGLEETEVLALRLYTTDSYTNYNNPIREHKRPHPFKMSLWYLKEGLKKLRSVDAKIHPADFRRTKFFWRGMRNKALNMTEFESRGGTELAPMSTTDSRKVALTYANSTFPLIMEFLASGMGRGSDISYLSVFPKEKEFLYPPLTYLEPSGTDTMKDTGQDIVLITPQIS